MMPTALNRRAQELAEQGVPFATATVVRVERPTSAKPGNTALVLEDGTIEGFVGGDCAEQSVREYALRAIDDGETILLRVVPFGGEEERGAQCRCCECCARGHAGTISSNCEARTRFPSGRRTESGSLTFVQQAVWTCT